MLNIVKYKNIFLIASTVLVLASWVLLAFFGLRLSRDFVGGTFIELSAAEGQDVKSITQSIEGLGFSNIQVTPSGQNTFFIRMQVITEEQHRNILSTLSGSTQVRYEAVGPVLGQELKSKAVLAVVIALVAIILYIAFAFRKVSLPVSSFKYGVAAVVALVHDVSILVGVFVVLGITKGVEVDALFITAALTVLGFSVHDTIVVFDRIRENLIKRRNISFAEAVNLSVNETLVRSINTSLTTLLVLIALYLFGGSSIEHFSLALIVGITVGTYSSISIAAPLLMIWEKSSRK